MSSKGIMLPPGQRFGRLTIIGPAPKHSRSRQLHWACLCDCGNVCTVASESLRKGHTSSCGCLMREFASGLNRTHGQSKHTPEFRIWADLRNRCFNLNNRAYQSYGGRGITVCPEWASFERFYADMGARPSAKHSIDRIDNDGPYSPDNCRWATSQEQNRNRRDTVRLTYDGRTLCLHEWAAITGITYDALSRRLCLGWTVDRALTQRPRRVGIRL